MSHKIDYKYPVWPELTTPKGPLPDDKRAQACWFYYTMAQKIYEKVGKSIDDQFGLMDGELWMDKPYRQLAKTVSQMYALESPDEFAKFWPYVKNCALEYKLPSPREEYMKPCPRDLVS